MKKVTFVTSNLDKLREIEDILGRKVAHVNLDLDEIQSMDIEQIVKHKVKQAYQKLGKPVIVEDVSLFIDQWQGFPGPFIRWFGDSIGYDKLATMVIGNNRNATWSVIYAYYDGKTLKTFLGTLPGKISKKVLGKAWGFSKVFIPQGYGQTLSQMGSEKKNQISARYLALQKLKVYLNKIEK